MLAVPKASQLLLKQAIAAVVVSKQASRSMVKQVAMAQAFLKSTQNQICQLPLMIKAMVLKACAPFGSIKGLDC